MGIDIYAKWEGSSAEEETAQYTGFAINAGHTGYLRESYHGGPYVTHYLVQEAFANPEKPEAEIPAAVLRKRLPAAVYLALVREVKVYGPGKHPKMIELGGGDETAGKTIAEAVMGALSGSDPNDEATKKIAESVNSDPGKLERIKALIAQRGELSDVALAFVDFVELCERKERETNKPCTIYASY